MFNVKFYNFSVKVYKQCMLMLIHNGSIISVLLKNTAKRSVK